MESLSERVLRENAGLWEAMQTHRFVVDIKSDALTAPVFHRYLVYEGAFVETAIRIFGLALVKAPGIDQQRWLIGVLDALANQQIAYFEQTFATLGIEAADYDLSVPAVVDFRDGMLRLAEDGGFLDIAIAMFAAEWMYWHWCREAAVGTISDPVLRRWVDLHAEEAFADQARWLKAQVDMAGTGLPEQEQARLSALFGHVLRLEIDFHTAAYG